MSPEELLARFGIYGASAVAAFVAGLVPPLSIEVFLIAMVAIVEPSMAEVTLCCLSAAVAHQIAKTITYYAGVGALEHGRLKKKIDNIRPRIDRWNKAPHLILFLAGAFGIPPLYILGFIAKPLMRINFLAFT